MRIKLIMALILISFQAALTSCNPPAETPQESIHNGPTPGIIVNTGDQTRAAGIETPSVSVYPLEVDPDQDNVLNVVLSGHPEYPIDNCPTVFNPNQEDEDHNGVGDACENP